jgi:tRNA 5-methylaminomethyl-2-thiouridine biosynthesis bifunctional protein
MARAGRFEPAWLLADLAGDAPVRDVAVARVDQTSDGAVLIGADGTRLGDYETVIIAGGHKAADLLTGLELEAGAGRVGVFDGDPPAAPAAWGGYAAACEGGVMIGATHVKAGEPEPEETAEPALRALAEDGPLALSPGTLRRSWGGVRAAVKDRLPVAGLLPADGFAERWGAAARGGPAPQTREPAHGAVLVLTALGARGFAHAPLLAEALVSALCKEPAPLQRDGLEALHPGRLAWRALKRG